MRRYRSALTVAALIVPLSLALSAPAADDNLPAVDFEAIAKSPVEKLAPDQKKDLTARIEFRLRQISQAKEAPEVIAARDGLLADYRAVDKSFYQTQFVALAVEKAIPVLQAMPAELKDLKEVNLALALSQMPQVMIQAALEKMIVHDDSGVRYCGWAGYYGIRSLVLAFPSGSNHEKLMYESLRRQAAKETSPPVVAEIFRMLQMPPVAPMGVSQQAFMQFQQTAYEILKSKSVWENRCREVMAGSAGMADACRRAVAATERFSIIFPNDPAKKKELLQMVLDMAWCSAKAYGNSLEAVKEESARVREANGPLLRDCESALSGLSGVRANYITQRLADSGQTVGLAVIDWAKALKDQGAASPEDRFASPASARAGATASAPASATSRPAGK